MKQSGAIMRKGGLWYVKSAYLWHCVGTLERAISCLRQLMEITKAE